MHRSGIYTGARYLWSKQQLLELSDRAIHQAIRNNRINLLTLFLLWLHLNSFINVIVFHEKNQDTISAYLSKQILPFCIVEQYTLRMLFCRLVYLISCSCVCFQLFVLKAAHMVIVSHLVCVSARLDGEGRIALEVSLLIPCIISFLFYNAQDYVTFMHHVTFFDKQFKRK